jgi:hypothetical protein
LAWFLDVFPFVMGIVRFNRRVSEEFDEIVVCATKHKKDFVSGFWVF